LRARSEFATMKLPSTEQFNQTLINTVPFVICPNCGSGAGHGLTLIDDFLVGKGLVCETCHVTTDAWLAF
jgi:hypothetical protein